MEMALKLGRNDFAARERHGFKDALELECRFLVGSSAVR
jgi:hypothetical protein